MMSFLSNGTLVEIMKGEEIEKPTFQILNIKNLGSSEMPLHKLVLSDGLTTGPYTILDARLNSMIINKELTELSIVEITSYLMCNGSDLLGKPGVIMVILRIAIKLSGEEVAKKIGNPFILDECSVASLKALEKSQYDNTKTTTEVTVGPLNSQKVQEKCHNKHSVMILTEGVLDEIIRGVELEKPILQILGITKFTKSGNEDNYRLDVTDGITIRNFAILDTKLNSMVTNNVLKNFSIIEITRYLMKCANHNSEKPGIVIPQIMMIFEIDVKIPGNKVNKRIGNPVLKMSKYIFTHYKNSNENKNYSEAILSGGLLDAIMSDTKINRPILQVLVIKSLKAAKDSSERYRLIISDGIIYTSCTMLSTQLNTMINNREITEFTIIEVTRYEMATAILGGKTKKIMVILGVEVVAHGDEVKATIGSPSCRELPSLSDAGSLGPVDNSLSQKLDLPDKVIGKKNKNKRLDSIKLSEGALEKIMKGVEIKNPILQILGIKKLANAENNDRFRLLVSDGLKISSFTMLATSLNSLITKGEVTENAICEVTHYRLTDTKGSSKIIMVILEMNLKYRASAVGEMVGNPVVLK